MNTQVGVTYKGRGSGEPPAPNAYSNYILLVILILYIPEEGPLCHVTLLGYLCVAFTEDDMILSYPSVTSYGEPLATWLAVWTFSQVVSMSALQAQGRGFDPHCG